VQLALHRPGLLVGLHTGPDDPHFFSLIRLG
jgi:hypothetical protein